MNILYGIKRDGILHESTICKTADAAIAAGKIYCYHSKEDGDKYCGLARKGRQSAIWEHLWKIGRVELVELQYTERQVNHMERAA